jgi:hypothetical protein
MFLIFNNIQRYLGSSSLSFRLERNLFLRQPRLYPFKERKGFPTSGNDDQWNRGYFKKYSGWCSLRRFLVPVMALILVLYGFSFAQPKIPKTTIPVNTPAHVKTLIELLYSPNPQDRSTAANKLGDLGAAATPAVPFLIDLFDDTHPVLLHGDEGIIGATSPDKEALTALVKVGRAAVEPLIAVLNDSDVLVRRNAAEALGKIKDRRAAPPLIALLGNEDPSLRATTVEA